ncbi:polyribonucleotide nucleotidyltransferase [Helicobacter sp. 23-1045]
MEIMLENGEILAIDEVAKKANGAILLRKEKAVILAVVAMEGTQIEGDFLPLTVQYIEKSYANGKIPSGFLKREGKPSDFEVLTSRLIDRSLRPLFAKNFRYPLQISVFVLSGDESCDLQVLALNAASMALYISNVPIDSAVSAIRVGLIDDNFVINPPNIAESTIDLFVAGSENISMIEFKSNCDSLCESKMICALNLAKEKLNANAKMYENALNPHKKAHLDLGDLGDLDLANVADCVDCVDLDSADCADLDLADLDLAFAKISKNYGKDLENVIQKMGENNAPLNLLKRQIIAESKFSESVVEKSVAKFKRNFIRNMILNERIRLDGRRLDEIRKISIATNILPNAHGSALFTRGETQVLAVCTLGAESDAQIVDNVGTKSKKERFLFHYNFPSFSTGEAYPIGAVGRRELGHGNLAKKALESSLKSQGDKTIRIVSEVLESNGSSSMASVCGGSLSLFAAGLKPEFLVAGVAMGLIKEGDKYAILSDIAGVEDFEGDMDFKVAGNENGITALQMDIKISDVSVEILSGALDSARVARLAILEKMQNAKAQIVLNDNAPKSETFSVPQGKIPLIIGSGGKNIKRIIERFEVSVDIAKDSGQITLFGANGANLAEAKAEILKCVDFAVEKFAVGEKFSGVVKSVVHFGVFVEIKNGVDGLIHASKLSRNGLNLSDFSEGQSVNVEIVGINNDKIELNLC